MDRDTRDEHRITIPNPNSMEQLGRGLSENCPEGTRIFLQGELGVGKTTLVRGFLRGLGHTGNVKSPTYTLVEPYLINGQPIYHFDLYRLNSPEELESIGLRDYFDGQGICLLEWPEKAESLLGFPDLWLTIEYAQDQRFVTVKSLSVVGASILEHLIKD